MVDDAGRTEQIATDILLATREGRCPLVLSDRKAHLENLAESFARLRGDADVVVFRFSSDDGLKRRRAFLVEIDHCATDGRPCVIFAKGRLIQYAGRLHRTHADKREVRIHDYLDENHAITQAIFRRRVAAYREMGYRFSVDENLTRTSAIGQLGLFPEADA